MAKVLTDAHLDSFAGQLTDKSEVRTLAIQLGGIDVKVVDACFKDNPADVKSAVFDMLKKWMRKQDSPEVAYRKMWNALRHDNVGLNSLASEYLHGPPDAPSSPPEGAGVSANSPPGGVGGAVGGAGGGGSSAQGRKKLTKMHLVNIAKTMPSLESKIIELATFLEVDDECDASLKNKPGDINQAVKATLDAWYLKQGDLEQAFVTLGEALKEVGLAQVAVKCLV